MYRTTSSLARFQALYVCMNYSRQFATRVNPSTFVSLLQTCKYENSLDKGCLLHALMLTSGFDPGTFLYNNLLSMYAKFSDLESAKKVFDQTPQRNTVTWNAIISAFSASPHDATFAFKLYVEMRMDAIRPNQSTFMSLLQASSSLGDHYRGSVVHSHVIKLGCLADVCIQSSLVGMYAKCGKIDHAKLAFDEIIYLDTIAWNSMTVGFLYNNEFQECILQFYNMLNTDSKPNQFSFAIVLNACSRSEDSQIGEMLHAMIIKTIPFPDTLLQNSLLDMYSSVYNIEAAHFVFKSIAKPDLVTWNSMFAAYARSSDAEKAVSLFMDFQHKSTGGPDEYTFAAVIAAATSSVALGYGKPIHVHIVKRGFETNNYVGCALIDMYFKNDEPLLANKIFNSMEEKDVVTWTAMITGYVSIRDGEKAIGYLVAMQRRGLAPDQFVLSSILSSSADLAAQKQGEMIHSLVVKTGYISSMFTQGSLVDMYAKSGSLSGAVKVFSEISNPDLKCWNSMLGGYSHHGNAGDAFRLFDQMLDHGVNPDQVTFISLLSACNHRGLVEKGRTYWYYMRGLEGLPSPGTKHYASMVGLLGRAGLLKEAKELIEDASSSCKVAELWRLLLSLCIESHDLEMGLHAAEQALRCEPDSIETHILISNLYSSFGRWDAVLQARRRIREMMVEKSPGLSWIEISSESHAFVANDQMHPRFNDIQAEVEKLKEHMVVLATESMG